jgi:hypothetical protein
MKTLLSSIAVFTVFTVSTIAQPTINASNLPATFSSNIFYGVNSGFNAGNAGANQTWNFATILTIPVGVYNTIPTAGSLYQSSFPTANYCYKQSLNGSDFYFYHKQNTTSFDILSFGYESGSGIDYTPNPKTLIQFPATYNSTFVDSYQAAGPPTATTYTVTYDGYGTLVMPFGSYSNTIRQKTVLDDGTIDYTWWNANPLYIIMQTDFTDNNIYIYQNTTTTNVANNVADAASVTISPNPITTKATISFTNEQKNTSVKVTDSTGKEIRTAVFSGKQYVFEKGNLATGIYYLQFSDASNVIYTKQIVVK